MGNEIKNVLVTVPYDGWYWEELEQALKPANIFRVAGSDTAGVSEALKEADVAILGGNLNQQIINEGKHLKWIHCDLGGINDSAKPQIFERGIKLTGSAGRSGPVLAEHTFFLILSLIYKMHDVSKQQKEHIWNGTMYVDDRGIYGKTIGVVGLGYTGKEVVKRAKAFGMTVLGYDRSRKVVPEGVDKMYGAEEGDHLEEMLKECDIVVVAIRLSDETYHMFDGKAFEAMKPTALFINMARGPIVDESALTEALKTGKIAGARCDTFEKEPLPADSPLWDLPNMVITPHCTPEMPDMRANCLRIICDNIRRYRAGEPLVNQLEPRDVYTK